MSDNIFKQAYELIKDSKSVLIVGHIRPDGDALSSISALSLIVSSLGKNFQVLAQDKPQDSFSYLPFFSKIRDDKEIVLVKGSLESQFDLILVADCGSLARTNLSEEILVFRKSGGKVIEFDHHPHIDDYADIEIRFPELSSTAELVYNFIVSNGIDFSRDLADCVLTGILTDTGNFLYPSASDNTMAAASAALAAGARYKKILDYTNRNKDMAMVKLWGLALENLRLNSKYQMAVSVIKREEINEVLQGEERGAAGESELFNGLAGFLSNISGAKAVLLIYEDSKGGVKGSLRSTSNGYAVDKLARALGGGGHEKAAGFSLAGRLEKINDNWCLVN